MIMSIAWLYDQELYQCLSPGCVTTNLVFFSSETIDHLITWLLSEWEFCHFITSRGWADSDQLILCLPYCVTTDQWSCSQLFPGCVSKTNILSHVSYSSVDSDHWSPVSFLETGDNLIILPYLLCDWQVIIESKVCMLTVCPEATCLVIWRVKIWSPLTWCWPEVAPLYIV